MKTRIIFIASLLIAGFVFSSFQDGKDDVVAAKNATVQSPEAKTIQKTGAVNGFYDNFFSKLIKNYPDPFITSTNIEFYVPKSDWVTLEVINMNERYVVRLVSEFKDRGHYRVFFDGTGHPPGRYRIELRVGTMLLMAEMIKVAGESDGTVNGQH
jgi:hypothetical protein